MRLRLVWISCLIIVGAVLALLVPKKHTTTVKQVITPVSNAPTVSFSDVKMIINSPQGSPEYELFSPKYWLYHEEQRSKFLQPRIIIYSKKSGLIHAKSLEGETFDNNNIIMLLGDVEIDQENSEENNTPISIRTEKLTLYPEKQKAHTKSDVIAVRGKQKVTASGMTIDLDKQTLYLHSNVVGWYER